MFAKHLNNLSSSITISKEEREFDDPALSEQRGRLRPTLFFVFDSSFKYSTIPFYFDKSGTPWPFGLTLCILW